jgi:ribosomal protein S15P/S13E
MEDPHDVDGLLSGLVTQDDYIPEEEIIDLTEKALNLKDHIF